MADKKITELPAITSAADDAVIPIVSDPAGTPVTDKITKQNFTKLVIPSADHTWSGPIVVLTAGAAIAYGEVCYMGADGKMEKGDADAVATAFCWAICLEVDGIAENATGKFGLPGCFVEHDAWAWDSLGQPLYLDTTTAGGMTKTAPSATDDVIQILGIALTADIVLFYPQLVQVEHT
jgi:hypothetical protein